MASATTVRPGAGTASAGKKPVLTDRARAERNLAWKLCAPAVILMLPNSDVVEGVITSPEVNAELAVNTLVIDMSSSEPHSTAPTGARDHFKS